MRGKIAREVRKYIRMMYPKVESEQPEVFEKMCKDLKNKYKATSVDQKGIIIENKP